MQAVVAGAQIREGTTWIIGEVLSPFAGFVTVAAPALSTSTSTAWHLVLVTAAELAGDAQTLLQTGLPALAGGAELVDQALSLHAATGLASAVATAIMPP